MSPAFWRIEHHLSVGSTNDLAVVRARDGEAEGLVITADEQTRGRGRHGRQWRSPPGNLHLSALLRPPRPPASCATLSLVAGLAVRDAVVAVTSGRLRPCLKWPNDVLLGSGKLAGVLLEAVAGTPAGPALVIGVGVNVAEKPDAGRPVASLRAAGERTIAVQQLRDLLLDALYARYRRWCAEGFAGQRAEWLAAAARFGEPVVLRLGRHEIRGRFRGIGEDGALELEGPDGTIRRCHAGELVSVESLAVPATG